MRVCVCGVVRKTLSGCRQACPPPLAIFSCSHIVPVGQNTPATTLHRLVTFTDFPFLLSDIHCFSLSQSDDEVIYFSYKLQKPKHGSSSFKPPPTTWNVESWVSFSLWLWFWSILPVLQPWPRLWCSCWPQWSLHTVPPHIPSASPLGCQEALTAWMQKHKNIPDQSLPPPLLS